MSEILNVVFKKGVLFDITIGRWSALHQMGTNDLLLKKLNRKIIYPGHKKLLPEEASYPLIHLEGKIRTFVRKRSMDFPVSGAVFVNFKTLPAMLKGLKQLRAEFEVKAQELYDTWEEVKEKQIKALDEESYKIAVQNGLHEPYTPPSDKEILQDWLKAQHLQHLSLYPDKDALLKKYYVSWSMFKVNPLEKNAAESISEEDAAFITQQQEQLKASMEKWVKDKAAEMHKKLGEAALQAKSMLADNGKLNPKNLKPLFNAFEEFAAIDFAGSSFEAVIDDIKNKYGSVISKDGEMDYKAVAENVNGSTDEFDSLLSTLADLAVEDVAKQAGATSLANSDFKRVVEI
jgi:hypothetical protein